MMRSAMRGILDIRNGMLSFQWGTVSRMCGKGIKKDRITSMVSSLGSDETFWFVLEEAFENLMWAAVNHEEGPEDDLEEALEKWKDDVLAAVERNQMEFQSRINKTIETRRALGDIMGRSMAMARRKLNRIRVGKEYAPADDPADERETEHENDE
jgi:hypothetical protein